MSTQDGDPPGEPPPPAPEEPAEVPPVVSAAPETPPLEAPPATDESILPTTYDEAALHDAVGVRPRKKRKTDEPVDEDGVPDEKRRNRKLLVIGTLTLVAGLAIVALVLFGRINSERYFLTCTTTHAIAEQGRSFPPWGSAPLPGAEWRAIALPPSAQCKPQQVNDRSTLEALFLEILLDRTAATLTSRDLLDAPPVAVDAKHVASPLDVVSMQLEQALLLSRAPERGDQRKQVERMQGDVQYWRASLRLRDAAAALADASRQFDQAALSRPLHVTDAGEWATFLRRLADELQAGPAGAAAAAAVPPGAPPSFERPVAPPGTALPVEPGAAAGSVDVTPAPPDAGVPTGGVLL